MNMPKRPKCLYNHELLILFTSQTPYQSYRDPVCDAQAEGYVRELADTQVDALMCCPTGWRAVLWPSEVDPRWRNEDLDVCPPTGPCDLTYYERAYWRMREYMITGADPVRVTRDTARDIGLDFFISYRMNDHHHLWIDDCPTHDRFWREHPEFHMPGSRVAYLNYMHKEVREYYAALLTELVEKYDPEGVELDFMRSPHFFPNDCLAQGLSLMTEFVRNIREMLDRTGAEGEHKLLSVRVPRSLDEARQAGLDVATWDAEELVDMVNVSPYFIATQEIDIESYRKHVVNASIYAEMHFITDTQRPHPSGHSNNYSQKTTPLQYETLAHDFWQRGVDGISFFNFAYCREHHMGDPRRRGMPGVEPPFDMLRTVCDPPYLAERPKHFFVNSNFDRLQRTVGAGSEASVTLDIRLPEGSGFMDAMLRIENDGELWGTGYEVALNGHALAPSPFIGELFPPFTRESLPVPRHTQNYRVPVDFIELGENVITLMRPAKATSSVTLRWRRLELALYPYTLPGSMTGAH